MKYIITNSEGLILKTGFASVVTSITRAPNELVFVHEDVGIIDDRFLYVFDGKLTRKPVIDPEAAQEIDLDNPIQGEGLELTLVQFDENP